MDKALLIIFVRNCEYGKVKTRLAKTIGDTAALKIYKALLKHTYEISTSVLPDTWIYYSEFIESSDYWSQSNATKKVQHGRDLGDRMMHTFRDGFQSGYDKIVLIGSDCFDLQPYHINSAFKALAHKNVSIGPAEDGGYYLIGMSEYHPEIFENINWGTSAVLEQTLMKINNDDVFLLEPLNDVDTFEDLKRHKALLNLIKPND